MTLLNILVLGLISSISVADTVAEVEVFTNNIGAIEQIAEQQNLHRSYRLTLHNMNAVEQWEKKFSEGLPGDEESARSEVDRRIEKMGGQAEFGIQVLEAYSPLVRATELGLLEYPAVVINENYVVYGTDSVTVGLERYRAWLRNNDVQ